MNIIQFSTLPPVLHAHVENNKVWMLTLTIVRAVGIVRCSEIEYSL